MEIIEITSWAKELLSRQYCPFCKTPYRPEDVIASGNRRKENKICYFYEVECGKCKNPAMSFVSSRPCDSYQLGIYLVQLYAELKDQGKWKKQNIWELFPKLLFQEGRSHISDEEVNMAKQIIYGSMTYEEFLKEIMTQEQFDKFANPEKGDLDGNK